MLIVKHFFPAIIDCEEETSLSSSVLKWILFCWCNHFISVLLMLISENELRLYIQRGENWEQSSTPRHPGKVEGRMHASEDRNSPFSVTWETKFYKEGARDCPVLAGRQELVTLWKLQGIGLVKMRSDRILICLSLLCRHTDLKGTKRGWAGVGAVVIRPSRLIGKTRKKKS